MKAEVIHEKCRGCRLCVQACRFDAIERTGKYSVINDKCTACNLCVPYCPFEAIAEARETDV